MLRRTCLTLLMLGLAFTVSSSFLTPAVRAQDPEQTWWGDPDPVTTKPTTDPVKPPVDDTKKPPVDDTKKPPTDDTKKPPTKKPVTTPLEKPATRESIEMLLNDGKVMEAEAGYMDWAGSWKEDDFALLADIENRILLQQYSEGNTDAFLSLMQVGDEDALNTFRTMLRTNKSTLTPEQFAVALHQLGIHGNSTDTPLFLQLLKNENPDVVNQAIDALGYLGDQKVLPKFYEMLSEADIKQTLTIGHAMARMGASKQLNDRYMKQIVIKFQDTQERASLMLALSGNPREWDTIQKMLDDKTPLYYPYVLSVLGNLPFGEAEKYVDLGLAGTPEEQAQAVQSITVFQNSEIDAKLKGLLNAKYPVATRLLAIETLGDRGTNESEGILRDIVTNITADDQTLTPAAITALEQGGTLSDPSVRGIVMMQMFNEDPKIAMAARTAIFSYAKKAAGL